MGLIWNRLCVKSRFRPTGEKISSHKISLEPPDSPPPIWPPFWRIAVQLDLLILLTCICFVPLFHIFILPISFFWFVQSNNLSNIDNVMALFITVFPLIGRWDLQHCWICWFCRFVFVLCHYLIFVSSQFHSSILFNATFCPLLSMLWLCLSLFFHLLGAGTCTVYSWFCP